MERPTRREFGTDLPLKVWNGKPGEPDQTRPDNLWRVKERSGSMRNGRLLGPECTRPARTGLDWTQPDRTGLDRPDRLLF